MSDERVRDDEGGTRHSKPRSEQREAEAPATPGEAPQLAPDPNEITSDDDQQGTEETADQIQDAFE
jgi:hypothetical protein